MNFYNKIKNFFSTRNLSIANSYVSKMSGPIYSKFKVAKAVKDGYQINGLVYRAINLIANSCSSVPWEVLDKNGEPIEGHYISELIKYPNPHVSKQDMFQLIISWLELSGNAYLHKVKAQGRTQELWPISPDRLSPIPSKDISEWMKGYALDESRTVTYEPEDIIHFLYFNPANPLEGISPLQAISRIVDTDNSMTDFSISSMQNNGVLNGVFSFKREFQTIDEANAVAEKLDERYSGADAARKNIVLGSEATYTRLSATPQELDFNASKRLIRDYIAICMGVPPVLLGSQESATYNNYQTSEVIFWDHKNVPLLSDLSNTFNMSFRDELNEGERIVPNLSNVPALRKVKEEQGDYMQKLFDMGVPFDQLNKIFGLGIEKFEDWDKSKVKNTKTLEVKSHNPGEIKKNSIETGQLDRLATRNFEKELKDRDALVENKANDIQELLDYQHKLIVDKINTSEENDLQWFDVEEVIRDTWQDWNTVYTDITLQAALDAADNITIEKRDTELERAIRSYLNAETLVLQELGHIKASTALKLIDQVESALDNGWTTTQLQQAIIDIGAFSPARALRLSRTIVGSASSIGQIVSAKSVNAQSKHWRTANDSKVRSTHADREAQGFIPMNHAFIHGGMYPLDPILSPADRCNCRCSLSFRIEKASYLGEDYKAI